MENQHIDDLIKTRKMLTDQVIALDKSIKNLQEDEKSKKEIEWPIITNVYVHGDKTFEDDLFDINTRVQYDIDDFEIKLVKAFKYLVYEMTVRCELYEDGSVFWTHINNVELPKKMKAT